MRVVVQANILIKVFVLLVVERVVQNVVNAMARGRSLGIKMSSCRKIFDVNRMGMSQCCSLKVVR